MAILVALFGKIKQIFSSYVLVTGEPSSFNPFVLNGNPYSMPLIYLFILGCILLIGYFCWQSYRQEVHEEKLQHKSAATEQSYSTYNLSWVNKLINWTYMSSPPGESQAVKRWIEDVNITLAKNQSPLKILLYGVRDGSIPPWLREVGQPKKVNNHIEIPLLLEATEFGFVVSIQEEDNGRVNASTYAAVVQKFQCWCTAIISRVEGQVLAKITPMPEKRNNVKFSLKSISDQKIASTVPEAVADMIKSGVMNTPFYLNVSTWDSVIPATQPMPALNKAQKDTNGNTVASSHIRRRLQKSKTFDADDVSLTDDSTDASGPSFETPRRKSNTLPTDASRVAAKQAHGLSGSLGSLVGIKRTPSGRGPAKPIRAREKQLVINVVKSSGLPSDVPLFCNASLDNPSQKCRTGLAQSGPNRSWPDDKLRFDLSSRSSEVKLVVLQRKSGSGETDDDVIASAILCLDGIDIERSSEQTLQLKTLSKTPAEITLQLSFTENPVDGASVKPHANTSATYSPRRSLDLSAIANQLPPIADEKGDSKSKSTSSTLSSFSTGNVSEKGSHRVAGPGSTTVTTTTTRKVSPNRSPPKRDIPTSKSAPNMKQAEQSSVSDTSLVNGYVAEIAMSDLSKKAEIAKSSPKQNSRVKKGRVVITAIGKQVDSGATQADANDEQLDTNGVAEEDPVPTDRLEKQPGEEMYYSMCSLPAPGGGENAVLKQPSEPAPATQVAETQEPPNTRRDTPPDQNAKPRKQHRKREKRPKSMVAGVRPDDMPKEDDPKEWPKVRRSRSLVFGKGRKKHYKTGSATDLDKHGSAKEEVYPEGYDEDSPVTVPENELQKHNKKKKSKSITKIFSKLGRKSSMRKNKKDSDIAEVAEYQHQGQNSLQVPESSHHSSSLMSEKLSHDGSIEKSPTSSDRPDGSFMGSETESYASETNSGVSSAVSHNASLTDEKSSVRRSKSLRKRLFGGKRKTTKN